MTFFFRYKDFLLNFTPLEPYETLNLKGYFVKNIYRLKLSEQVYLYMKLYKVKLTEKI